MAHLTIVADIIAAPDKIDVVKDALLNLIPPTRAEAGCIQYDMHQDTANPAHFLFFEIWESRDLWLDHMKSPHIVAHGPAMEGLIETVTLSEMTRIA